MNSTCRKLWTPRDLWKGNAIANGVNVMSGLYLEGSKDLKDRVACALSTGSEHLTISGYRYSPSRLSARCSGDWNGKRFFAKILLADPYPIPDRFIAPWEISAGSVEPARPVSEQIEVEWEMTLKMHSLSRGDCVPEALGKSVPARTIVWEEAKGVRLDHAIRWSRLKGSFATRGARALFQAGSWLRKIHDVSLQGTESVDMSILISRVSAFARQSGTLISEYERTVPKILEAALPEIGSAFLIPVAFTHGDFCLSNLISESAKNRVAVIDFELCGVRPIYHDLFALLSELYSQFLNPLVPKTVIQSWERAFWDGYGPASAELKAFARALALARIFYHDLFRLLTRRKRKGWIAGVNAQMYRLFLEPIVLTRRLDLPPELCPF